MQIRVLGPIEVVVEEHARSLPGAGERELLALLALAAGRVVAVPALIDALWDGQLPANPGNALQVRVSKLRRALTAAGLADTLLTRPAGYLLDVDPSSRGRAALRPPGRRGPHGGRPRPGDGRPALPRGIGGCGEEPRWRSSRGRDGPGPRPLG